MSIKKPLNHVTVSSSCIKHLNSPNTANNSVNSTVRERFYLIICLEVLRKITKTRVKVIRLLGRDMKP